MKTRTSKTRNYKGSKSNTKLEGGSGFWLFGKHSVFSAIKSGRRKIFKILISSKSNAEALKKELFIHKKEHLASLIEITDQDRITRLSGADFLHQGIAMQASKLSIGDQNSLIAKLEKIPNDLEKPTLLIMDEIQDPQNFGAIIRSAISFGVIDIIFCSHNSSKETPAAIKASSGTIEQADLFEVTNLNNLLEKLKKLDYWCIGLAGEAKLELPEVAKYRNIALIVGCEGEGMRSLVKKNCDLLLRINIDNKVESLNASVASAIALYEIKKTRNIV